MGKSNKALESKSQDDLNVIEVPEEVKEDETVSNDTDAESNDTVFNKNEQPKNLDATQLYLGK